MSEITPLKDLMGHIDYFFESVSSTYDANIRYQIQLKEHNWSITSEKDGSIFETVKHEDALGYLVEKNADLYTLHHMIFNCIVLEGSLRRLQLKKCEEMVGSAAIDKSDEGLAKFFAGIKDAVSKLDEEKEKKEEEEVKEEKKSKFSIVGGND